MSRGPQRNPSPRGPGRDTLPYQLITPLLRYILREIPLRISTARSPPSRFPMLPSASSFFLILSTVTESNITQNLPADVRRSPRQRRHVDDDDCDDGSRWERRDASPLLASIFRTCSDDDSRNTAMRREACPCSTLRNGLGNADVRVVPMMWARTQTGGSDRLVPPRLRRAAHLLTEYHCDSYITTIMVHTPAMRTTGCSRKRRIEVNPEARSLALLPPHRAATAMAVSWSWLPQLANLSGFFVVSPPPSIPRELPSVRFYHSVSKIAREISRIRQ